MLLYDFLGVITVLSNSLINYLQDLHLNRVVVKESTPNSPEPADPHHRHPKQAKVKSYDLSVMDKFWGSHKGRCVRFGWEKYLFTHIS